MIKSMYLQVRKYQEYQLQAYQLQQIPKLLIDSFGTVAQFQGLRDLTTIKKQKYGSMVVEKISKKYSKKISKILDEQLIFLFTYISFLNNLEYLLSHQILKLYNISYVVLSNYLQTNSKMTDKLTKMCFIFSLILLITNIPVALNFNSFGMNKPHLLFHLGDRMPVSKNVGWGYWQNGDTLRLKYANTDQDVYAHMTIHDGQTFFQQKIEDKKLKINTEIRYQLTESNSWQAEIQMENRDGNEITWFTYVSVENNDYRLIDHEKYTSYIHLIPLYKNNEQNQMSLKCFSLLYQNQTLSIAHTKRSLESDQQIKEGEQIKMFGVSANISQTHTMYPICDTLKKLVRISRGQDNFPTQTKSFSDQDKKILQWQKKQVQFIKEDKWTNKSYVILFNYGTVKKGQKSRIFLTNSTQNNKNAFNTELFKKRTQQFTQLYKKHLQNEPEQKKQFVKHVISNLYGGMTFYHGRLYTQNSLTVHRQDYSYTFTPSRLIFPRSFLWDDGFHQSVIVNYNPDIVLDVLTNWVNKIDIFGWIGREQIRGGEISNMMPDSRFVFQDWFEMNPPTLMMSIISLIKKSESNIILSQKVELFLQNFYRKLQNWYRYFKNTQSHQSLDYEQSLNSTDRFFRWHCKDQCSKGNFMGSGLDDYPRRQLDTQIAKQHVDLLSWLYLFSKSLATIGEHMQKITQKNMKTLGQINGGSNQREHNKYTRRVKYYKKQSDTYIHQLYDKFYDESDSLYKDIVVEKVDLFIQKFVNKIGYINLFPFFTGMLADQADHSTNQFIQYNEKRIKSLKKCLEVMSDQKLLLSQDGLRSLSFSDPLYGTDENYWRGAVWLPINYMVLRACKLYYWNDPNLSKQIRQFYSLLRQKLINSIYKTYKDTGYLYENYYQGRGHRGFPFYGWTATIVNIITEQY